MTHQSNCISGNVKKFRVFSFQTLRVWFFSTKPGGFFIEKNWFFSRFVFSRFFFFSMTFFQQFFQNWLMITVQHISFHPFLFSFFNLTWAHTDRNFDRIRNESRTRLFCNCFDSCSNDIGLTFTYTYFEHSQLTLIWCNAREREIQQTKLKHVFDTWNL